MNLKSFTLLLLIAIAVVTLAVFLYSFSYNLAYGQLENNDHSIPQQYEFGNGSSSIPYPNEGEILIVVGNLDGDYLKEWSGTVMYGNGDIKSFDGIGMNYIVMECIYGDTLLIEGQPYSVSFRKGTEEGNLFVGIYKNSSELSIEGLKKNLIDSGNTDAAYGLVSLVGTC